MAIGPHGWRRGLLAYAPPGLKTPVLRHAHPGSPVGSAWLFDDRLVAVVAIRRGVSVVGQEDEPAVAEADLIARPQDRRAGDPLAVDERAVLGRRVVDFTRVGGVNDDRTMPAGNAAVEDGDVV